MAEYETFSSFYRKNSIYEKHGDANASPARLFSLISKFRKKLVYLRFFFLKTNKLWSLEVQSLNPYIFLQRQHAIFVYKFTQSVCSGHHFGISFAFIEALYIFNVNLALLVIFLIMTKKNKNNEILSVIYERNNP